MVAAAFDLGACVCEDDATVSELDDLRARVRVQAKQIAALQEALSFYAAFSTYEESAEPHPTRFASGLVPIEQDSGRWARSTLSSIAHAEGCAAPAPRVPAEPCVDCTHDYCRCAALAAAPADEEEK